VDIHTNPLSTNPWINAALEMHYKFYGKKKLYHAIYINHNTFPYLHNRINSKTFTNIHLLLLDIKHYSREKLLLNESYTENNSGASHMTNLIYKFTINVVLVAVYPQVIEVLMKKEKCHYLAPPTLQHNPKTAGFLLNYNGHAKIFSTAQIQRMSFKPKYFSKVPFFWQYSN